MAILIVQQHGRRRGTRLLRRLLIGRRKANHVVIDDRTVSMVHAWIDKRGDECILTDTGSRLGTYVNGKRITRPLPLCEGDQITVGPVQMTFLSNGDVIDRVEPIETVADEPEQVPTHAESTGEGWLFDCTCGAPLWAGTGFAGRLAYCRYCGRQVRVPTTASPVPAPEPLGAPGLPMRQSASPIPPPAVSRVEIPASVPAAASLPEPVRSAPNLPARREAPARSMQRAAAAPPPAPAEPVAVQFCGICQTEIDPAEATTACPSCGLTFHADCWVENRGCSAYGCPQVGALDRKDRKAGARTPGSTAAPDDSESESEEEDDTPAASVADMEKEAKAYNGKPAMPWEHAVLAASVGCFVVSTLTFGVPSLAIGIGILIYLSRAPGVRRKTGILLIATFLALCGLIVGIAISWFWWIGFHFGHK